MADYTIAADEVGVHAVTLTASTVLEVVFADDVPEVEIVNMSGTAAIYFTVDGTVPTVGGRATRLVPAAVHAARIEPPTAGGTTVKLISAGTPTVSIARA